ncbi:prepilin-type N-terminal cleavage/methylation domain-containing protein [Marinobacteraceae bacterium S3BR75-40.1]
MRTQQGLTLVELVITIVIIGAAVAGVVGAFALMAGRSADVLWEARTSELGQLYLDEILTKRWADGVPNGGAKPPSDTCAVTGLESGENAANAGDYDDVDDFDDINGVNARFLSGSIGSEYNGYTIDVAVTCAGNELGGGFSIEDAKRIDVTITPPSGTGAPMTFTAYKANF